MIIGLPPVDVPFFERDPRSCKRCAHAFYSPSDLERRYLRCGFSKYKLLCCYQRHETGWCGPDAVNWKDRGTDEIKNGRESE
jgi:hypothetical protein